MVRVFFSGFYSLAEALDGQYWQRNYLGRRFGDAEPTTANELVPALIAQQDGYTNVGLHVDPGDWKRPGVAAIVKAALDQVSTDDPEKAGQIVLLHDSGGYRAQIRAATSRP